MPPLGRLAATAFATAFAMAFATAFATLRLRTSAARTSRSPRRNASPRSSAHPSPAAAAAAAAAASVFRAGHGQKKAPARLAGCSTALQPYSRLRCGAVLQGLSGWLFTVTAQVCARKASMASSPSRR